MTQVLVATGDRDMRESMGFALASAGYQVREADTGIGALTLMAASARPLVVVLDAPLPDLDGSHVLRFAAAALHTSWLSGTVLLTSDDRQLSPPRGRGRGAQSPQILAKPVNRDTLLRAVHIAATRQRAAVRRATGRTNSSSPVRSGVRAARHG